MFVPRALPGDVGRVSLVQEKRDFARGELASLVSLGPGRVEPPCPAYRAGCGGCSWQHAEYAVQLALKKQIVVDQLRRIGHFADAADLVKPTLGMIEPWHYRNQARFTVGRREGELCFTFRGTRHLLRIDHCWITHPRINEALQIAQGRFKGIDRHIHQISMRVGANTGQMLIAPPLPEIPELETGQSFFEEELLGRRFRLQPSSFFQVNTHREIRDIPDPVGRPWLPIPEDGISMAELLALLVLDRVQPTPESTVIDAYCGVGTFALLIAPLVRDVIGIEEARSAIRDAEHNATDLENVRFICAKSEVALPQLQERPSAVILDPARVGCHPDVLSALLRLRPARIVYVSCDPTTLARDLRVLVDGNYQLQNVQPLDMFPQTYHVENVALLTL
ncbi:MAG: 23S rRNA (uracil(1939)-C(5))-methyltransferase RlmD [Chloroflexota bacterium]